MEFGISQNNGKPMYCSWLLHSLALKLSLVEKYFVGKRRPRNDICLKILPPVLSLTDVWHVQGLLPFKYFPLHGLLCKSPMCLKMCWKTSVDPYFALKAAKPLEVWCILNLFPVVSRIIKRVIPQSFGIITLISFCLLKMNLHASPTLLTIAELPPF